MTQKDRKEFSAGTKIDTMINQGFRCANPKCHKKFMKTRRPNFDHKRGRTDRSPKNCQALCPNCHINKNIIADRKKTAKQRKRK